MQGLSKTSAVRVAGHRMVRHRLQVFWYVGGALVSFAFAFLLLPILFGLYLLGRAVQAASGAPHRGAGVTLLGGLAMLVVASLPLGAMLIAAQLFPSTDGPSLTTLCALVLSAIAVGALMGPFLTVAPHLFRRGDRLVDAVGHALAASALRGLGPTLVRGVILGVGIALCPLALALLVRLSVDGMDVWLAPLALVLLVPFVHAWLIGFAAASADEDEEQLSEASPPLGWRTQWPFLLPAASLVFATITVLCAAFTPLRAWQAAPMSLRDCPAELHAVPPHGLDVVPDGFVPLEMHPPVPGMRAPNAFMVSTADGGGAGLVYGPAWSTADVVCPAPGDDGYVLRFNPGLGVPIDARGVRRDDEISDRVSRRVGWAGAVLLGLGVSCLFSLTRALGGRLALLRALDGAEDSLRSLGGRLELDHGAMLARDGMSGESRGDVTLVSSDGATRVRLPASLTILGRVAPEVIENLSSGTPARLLSVGPIGSSTHRSAVEAWPRSGVLSVGPQNDARAALMAGIARAAATWVVGASLAFGAAGCWVLFQL